MIDVMSRKLRNAKSSVVISTPEPPSPTTVPFASMSKGARQSATERCSDGARLAFIAASLPRVISAPGPNASRICQLGRVAASAAVHSVIVGR